MSLSSTAELAPIIDRWDELIDAIETEDFATIDQLISEAEAHGTKELEELLEHRGPDGWTALLIACDRELIRVVNRLLAAGADIEATNDHCRTALLITSLTGNFEVVDTLLAAGAHPNSPDQEGRMALSIACQEGHL